MKKSILLILSLFIFFSCNDTITESPTEQAVDNLSKKPPKPDPEPESTFPALDVNSKHIAGVVDQEVFIWETVNYSIVWSYQTDALLPKVGFVNVDNESYKKLILFERLKGGKGRNKYEKYYFSVFKEGDSEPVRYEIGDRVDYTDAIWDMKIGNVDTDTDDEIVLVRRDRIEIYELDDLNNEAAFGMYGYDVPSTSPWEGEIVDYDNDGINEILVGFTDNFWASYQYTGSSAGQIAEGSSYPGIGILNVVKAADLDNDGNMEVIGGGSAGRVLLWENATNPVLASEPFSEYSFTWALDFGPSSIYVGLNSGGIYSLNYAEGTGFTNAILKIPDVEVQLNGLIVTEADGSGEVEFIVGTANGLKVFDNLYQPLLYVENQASGFLDELVCR